MKTKLEVFLAIHHQLCQAANLPEAARPFGLTTKLTKVQESIMEEFDKLRYPIHLETYDPTKPNNSDDCPF